MLKRFFLILAFAGLLSPAYAAGTIPFSLSQQLDQFGKPLAGCKFYTIRAGTTSTPQNAYQDNTLTIPLPNPQTCDASGRLPQMFLADGSIKVRLTDKFGVNIVTADGVAVVGSSSGGGGGGTVDPTTIMQPGFIAPYYGTGVRSGFVRANGRTIGSSTSGATERANSDCQSLFEYLWGVDANLVVSTGRGASANADWVANKTIVLPDWRGRAIAALDDMGNSAAGRLTATYFGATATVLGAAGGGQTGTLTSTAQFPPYTPTGTVSGTASVTGTATSGQAAGVGASGSNPIVPTVFGGSTNFSTLAVTASGSISAGFSGAAVGSSAPFGTVSPMMLATVYLKL